MNDRDLSHDLFLLVGYLLTSAHGLYREPQAYGPFRLLDAARRLLTALGNRGMLDPYLQRLHDALEAACTGPSGEAELRELVNGLLLDYADELKTRLAAGDGE